VSLEILRYGRFLTFFITEGIWSGRIVYHAVNQYAIIADVSAGFPRVMECELIIYLTDQDYKKRPIQIYNPHKAPLLDHYRYSA
jgi:hypothetical protein